MTSEELEELFQKHENDEYLKFERVTSRASNRPDLHAFILMDKRRPTASDIITGSTHGEIYLGRAAVWAECLEHHHVIELLRCGVMCHDGYLCMNV